MAWCKAYDSTYARAWRPSAWVQPGETADATIEVTAGVARALNLLHTDDPRFALAMEDAIRTGALVIEGDLSPISAALAVSHDAIVDRTS